MKEEYIKILKRGGVAVLGTDTLLGIVGSAFNKKTVDRIYKIKKRNKKKPFIILIASFKDLKKFGIKPVGQMLFTLKKYWPGKVSIILDCKNKKFQYLHRGKKSLAFRMPAKKTLLKIIKKTGPLIAPSANAEGRLPAKNIKQARKYFGDKVDFYFSQNKPAKKPSALIKIDKDKIKFLRS